MESIHIEQGTAFIVRRDTNPIEFRLIVLNKVGLENLVLDMGNCKKAKIQDPYIMMKCSIAKGPIIFGERKKL